jgi:hypothetical protein
MPTLNINGKRVTVDDSFMSLSPEQQDATVDEIAASMAPQQPAQSEAPVEPSYTGLGANALTEGSQAGLMFGFDDELSAGFNAPFHAAADWYQGRGFDIGKAYTKLQQQGDARKDARRSEKPLQSLTGEVLGGMALPARVPGAATAAPTMAKAIGTGAAYGAATGAGEADPGLESRLGGAATGAAIGGITGGVLQGIGNKLATNSAQKAASAATPASDDIRTGALALKQQAMDEGVNFKQVATQRLADNLKLAAGRPNDRLRPLAGGYTEEIGAIAKGDMSFADFDEFRKGLNATIKTAKGEDQSALLRMKTIVDEFAENPKPGTFTGDAKKASSLYNRYKAEYSKSKQTEVIEKIMDNADRKGSGKFTQGGFANAVKGEMESLYKKIQSGKEKGWSKEQVELIRQMAKGGSTSKVLNLLSKFDPKGVVSTASGLMLGGPGLMAAGHVAGRMREKGMEAAAQALLSGTASGTAPVIQRQVSRTAMPLIPGGVAASMGVPRLLEGSPRR